VNGKLNVSDGIQMLTAGLSQQKQIVIMLPDVSGGCVRRQDAGTTIIQMKKLAKITTEQTENPVTGRVIPGGVIVTNKTAGIMIILIKVSAKIKI
jgi:hypothetical protein